MLLVFATLGPLVVTNILWFRSLDRIGASRATLATNLQPFVAAIFAVVLLGETIDAVQVLGGSADRRRDPRRAAAVARLAGGVRRIADVAVRCADEPAATHRARLGRRGRRADGDQARHRPRERQPRSRLRGAALRHRSRCCAAHVLRDRRRRPASRPVAPVRPRQGGAPRRAGRGGVLLLVSVAVGALAVARLVGWIEIETSTAWWVFAAVGVVILIDISRTAVSLRAARRFTSPALASNALHFGSDLVGTLAVLVRPARGPRAAGRRATRWPRSSSPSS